MRGGEGGGPLMFMSRSEGLPLLLLTGGDVIEEVGEIKDERFETWGIPC